VLSQEPPAGAPAAGLLSPDLEYFTSGAFPLAVPPGVPLAGVLPLDLEALGRGVDNFFARLASSGADRDTTWPAVQTASWLTVTTAVAIEFARLHKQKPVSWAFSDRAPVLGLPVLLPGELT
jgi:hypothetical protein